MKMNNCNSKSQVMKESSNTCIVISELHSVCVFMIAYNHIIACNLDCL